MIFWSLLLVFACLACGVNGDTLYFTSDRDGNKEIYSTILGTGEEHNLTNTAEEEYGVILSPDRQKILFLVGPEGSSSIDVIDLKKSQKDGWRHTITKGSGKFLFPRWSPDAGRVVFLGITEKHGSRVYITDVSESDPVRLSDIESTQVGDWAPDGGTVAFSSGSASKLGIHVRNPDGVNQRQITCGKDYAAVWSPDSQKLLFISERDGNKEIYTVGKDDVGGLCDQKEERSKTIPLRLTESDEDEYDISWSPDGKRILYVSERDGNAEIYIMEESGNKKTRLTFNDVRDHQPTWSPDGKRIAFVSEQDGDSDIFTMNDSGGDQTRITNNDQEDVEPRW